MGADSKNHKPRFLMRLDTILIFCGIKEGAHGSFSSLLNFLRGAVAYKNRTSSPQYRDALACRNGGEIHIYGGQCFDICCGCEALKKRP
jgi:hypothetical protein